MADSTFLTIWGPLGNSEPELRFAAAYLDYFGYLSKTDGTPVTTDDLQSMLKDFQAVAGIPETGVLDPLTTEAFTWPRCQHTDHEMLFRRRRFGGGNSGGEDVSSDGRWTKRQLTYHIDQYIPNWNPSTQDEIVQQAWQAWMDVCQIDIRPTNNANSADLRLSIGTGKKDGFDGPSGVLAWAQLPNGRDNPLLMRFDSQEVWVTDPRSRGILLLAVATHEFGHMLGLQHSSVSRALMAPFYNVQVVKPQQNDDIPRVVRLYGGRSTPSPTPTPAPTPTPTPSPIPAPAGEFTITLKFNGQLTGADLGSGWAVVRRG